MPYPLFLAVLCAFSSPQDKQVPIIDTHAHFPPAAVGGGMKGGRRRPMGGGRPPTLESMAEEAIAAMDKSGVEKTVLMCPPLPAEFTGRYDWEELAPIVKKHPDRFAFAGGGGTLTGMLDEAVTAGRVSDDLRARFETAVDDIAEAGAVAYGELTALHLSMRETHPFVRVPPDHELFLLLADRAAAHGIPIDLHMDAVLEEMDTPSELRSPQNPKTLSPNVEAMERLLRHNLDAKIVWAHAGYDPTGDRTVDLMRRMLKEHANLHMAIVVHELGKAETRPMEDGKIRPEWVELLREFPDRFVIGTDQFHGVGDRMPRFLPDVRSFVDQLPADLARKVARENAERLYRLK